MDVWALGITCIELAETVAPLSFIDPMRAIFQIVVKESPTLEDKDKWSENFHDFLSLCLERNPKKRPSSSDLLLVILSFNSHIYSSDINNYNYYNFLYY